jgi:hypothetical protein
VVLNPFGIIRQRTRSGSSDFLGSDILGSQVSISRRQSSHRTWLINSLVHARRRTVFVLLIATLAVVIGAGLEVAPVANAASAPTSAQQAQLFGKCASPAGDKASAGALAVMWNCIGTKAQHASIPANGKTGAITIGGLCLDVHGALVNSARVDLNKCNKTKSTQAWKPQNGQIVNVASSMCLDDWQYRTTNGIILDIYPCNNGKNQKWALVSTYGYQELKSGTTPAECANDSNGDTSANAGVDLWDCVTANAQRVQVSGNTIKLNGHCLDVRNGALTNGSRIVLNSCSGRSTQQWTISGGKVSIKGTNYCLTDPYGAVINGWWLQIQTCSPSTRGQTWSVSTALKLA